MGNNSSIIKDIGSTVAGVASTVGSVSKTAIDLVKGIQEIKALKKQQAAIDDISKEQILNAIPSRGGKGFKII